MPRVGIPHAYVIIDAVVRRNGFIAPAVVLKQFTAAPEELLQVGTDRGHYAPVQAIGPCYIAIEVKGLVIPDGIVEQRKFQVVSGRPAATRPHVSDSFAPTSFPSALEARVDLLLRPGIHGRIV